MFRRRPRCGADPTRAFYPQPQTQPAMGSHRQPGLAAISAAIGGRAIAVAGIPHGACYPRPEEAVAPATPAEIRAEWAKAPFVSVRHAEVRQIIQRV